jgi:PIN domain nuclease of toxin-antitoxin system
MIILDTHADRLIVASCLVNKAALVSKDRKIQE